MWGAPGKSAGIHSRFARIVHSREIHTSMLFPLLSIPPAPQALTFGPANEALLAKVFALEEASYPVDEAATEAKLLSRMREAPEFFRTVCDSAGEPMGFICGTLTCSPTLTDESVSAGAFPCRRNSADPVCLNHASLRCPCMSLQGRCCAFTRSW